MSYQDIVLVLGSVVFSASLFPQLRDCWRGQSLNLFSCVVTTTVLFVYCVTYASLGLWFAAIPMTASMWAAITILSFRNRKNVKKFLKSQSVDVDETVEIPDTPRPWWGKVWRHLKTFSKMIAD
jgi:hypothetical protein